MSPARANCQLGLMRQNIFPTYFPRIHSGNEAKYGSISLVSADLPLRELT